MTSCHRHPERAAKRKCFRCREIICIDCYWRREGHIFCSRACHIRWRAKEIAGGASRRLSRPIPVPVAAVAILLAALPIGLILGGVTDELNRGLVPGEARRREPPLTASILSMEESEQSLTVSGQTSPGALAFLLRDGEPVSKRSAAADGSFRFEVPLPEAATTWSVAAVAPERVAEASFQPRRRELPAVPKQSIRSASTRYVENFTRGPAERPEVVLSLDAGSSARGAEATLDVLRDRGIRTTIFLTGQFIDGNPEIVKRILADGHEVGNHTWSHPRLTTFERNRRHLTLDSVTREFLRSQLERTEAAFRRVTGRPMAPYWRAPFGEENSEIRGWAAELGYLHVGWTRGRKYNLDSLDWVSDRRSAIYFDPDELAERLIRFGEANGTTLHGGIVLMHLGSDREEDERLDKALPKLIDGLASRGLRFVSVTEMRRGDSPDAIGRIGQIGRPTGQGTEDLAVPLALAGHGEGGLTTP